MRFEAVKTIKVLETVSRISMASACGHNAIPSTTFYDALADNCQEIVPILYDLGMRPQAERASQLVEYMRDHHESPSETSINNLRLLIHHDLERYVFEAVPVARAPYYDTNEPFGPDVSSSFPSVSFDIREAGTCYALGRHTACVFHLMRALEIGLGVLADHFSVSSDRQNWNKIIEGIESAIRKMPNAHDRLPDWKEQQEFYSRAAMQFMFFKDAWRNHIAHARDKCTEDEAETVLHSVRAFMQTLAARLHE